MVQITLNTNMELYNNNSLANYHGVGAMGHTMPPKMFLLYFV